MADGHGGRQWRTAMADGHGGRPGGGRPWQVGGVKEVQNFEEMALPPSPSALPIRCGAPLKI